MPAEQFGVLDHLMRAAVGTTEVDRAEGLQQVGDRLLDHVARKIVGVDQQRDTKVAVFSHAWVPVSRQARLSPPRSGLSWASPKGSDSGSVQASRRSVTVPWLRGRP